MLIALGPADDFSDTMSIRSEASSDSFENLMLLQADVEASASRDAVFRTSTSVFVSTGQRHR